MIPRLAYREFHEQTTVATTVLVALAEFGITKLQPRRIKGQELVLHGLLARGRFEDGRGGVLRNAIKHLVDSRLLVAICHDAQRTQAMRQLLATALPGFRYLLPDDLGLSQHKPIDVKNDFKDDARILLIEARFARPVLRVHVLLARRGRSKYYVMNPETGRNIGYDPNHFLAHLRSPVAAGQTAIGGRQYIFTGIAIRIWKQHPLEKSVPKKKRE